MPLCLGPARFETGVITGSRTVNPIHSPIVPGVDDGKVSDAIGQTVRFLRDGAFVHGHAAR
jgi:hypothetical protein